MRMDDLTELYRGVMVVDYSKPHIDFATKFDKFHFRLLTIELAPLSAKLATIEYSLVRLKRRGYKTPRVRGIFEKNEVRFPYLSDLLHVCSTNDKVFWGMLADRKFLVALTKPVLLQNYDPHVPTLAYILNSDSQKYERKMGLWSSLVAWEDQAFLAIRNRRYSI